MVQSLKLIASYSTQIFSTNNTECGRLLEEIKCARCSPNGQVLFHSPDTDKMPHREPDLPRLCQEFCREFYYTCRGHIPGNSSDRKFILIWRPRLGNLVIYANTQASEKVNESRGVLTHFGPMELT